LDLLCVCSDHHEGHFVIFIAVQNLVGIDAVVLIIQIVFRFREFGLKTPIHAPKIVFLGFDPLNGEQYHRNSQKAHHWEERRHMTYNLDRQNQSTGATCARDEDTKKERKTKKEI